MITCPKCQKEVPDDARICPECGVELTKEAVSETPVTKSEEAVEAQASAAPEAEKEAPAPETKAVESVPETKKAESAPEAENTAPAPQAENTAAPAPQQPAPQKKSSLKLPLIIGGAIAVCAVAAIAGSVMINVIRNSSGSENYGIYLRDDELYYSTLGKKNTPLQVSSRLYISDVYESLASYIADDVTVTDNGKYIFYPDKMDDSSYTLYYRSLKKKDAEGEKIDSDVRSYYVNSTGSLLYYLKGSDGTLYQYDLKDKEKISSDVAMFYVSEDGKTILYLDSDGRLFTKTVGKEKEKVDSDVDYVDFITDDFSTVYYTKEDVLYMKHGSDDKVKIDSDISSVITIYNDGTAYYVKSEEQEFNLSDYVTDDMAALDAAMTEPEAPEKPSYYDYIDGISYDDYDTYEEYEAAYDQAYEDYLDACDAYEIAYDAYYDAYYEYYDKLERDELREELEEETFALTNYTLYYYNGKESVEISDISSSYGYKDYAADKAVIVYSKPNRSEISKVKLSEIYSVYEVESLIYDTLDSADDVCIAVAESFSVIEQTEGYCYRLDDAGENLYFLDDLNSSYDYGDLYHLSITNGTAVKPELYDTDVAFTSISLLNDGKSILYFKDVDDYSGELFINKVSVEDDVIIYGLSYVTEDNKLYYFTDWNDDKEYGTLKLYDGKNSVVIDEDVHDYTLTPTYDVIYLREYSVSREKGDLYLYNGGKENRRLDEDVVAIVPFTDNTYDANSCYYNYRYNDYSYDDYSYDDYSY
jgi:RNA polymerase subunit RPABC4/transcription elongation factor Spt4